MKYKSAITDIFIRRPVLAIVVNLVIIIAGLQAWRTLSVRQYPRSDNASITIRTMYIGADADLVRGFITTPIERAIASADGIDYIQSKSSQSMSEITARLRLNFDGNKALTQITAKVNQVRGDLPPEAEVPLINLEPADSSMASAYLSFSSDVMEQNEITDYLTKRVQPRLSAVAGVQRADVLGARTYAMRIWLKPDRMAALDITPGEVRQALGANNYLSALGSTKGALVQVPLTANTNLKTVEEFKRLVVRGSGDTLIRLEDISDVVLGADNYSTEVRFSGQKAVFMGVWVQPNSNAIDVIGRVSAEMEKIKKEVPNGLQAGVAYDATAYINDAIHEVVKTLGETLLIVVAIIFLFLGTWRTVLIPIMAIPISLIGAVFLMQAFGFTLNLLTLLAIVLSVGLVVDDAIVVVENIERHLRAGMSPVDAALAGARELVGPVISMTITLAAVYTPIGLQGGLTGALFREFALTLAGAVLISGIVAITLSPMMASRLLNRSAEEHGFAGMINHHFDRFRQFYGQIVDASLKRRWIAYSFWIVLFIAIVPMWMLSPKELAPTEDQGFMFGIITDAPANATLDETARQAEAINTALTSTPEFDYSFQITFPSGGFGGMVVKPWSERNRNIFEILPEVQQKTHMVPGVSFFPLLPPALPGGSDMPVEFIICSTEDHDAILSVAQELQAKAMGSGKFMFLNADTKIDQPQARVIIDREKVAAMGLNLQQVGYDVAAAIGGNYVNRFSIAGNSFKVIPQVERLQRLTTDQLSDIHVSGPKGQLISLGSIAHLENNVIPRSLGRFQQLNAVKISGVTMSTLDDALSTLEGIAKEVLPAGFTIDYTGESRQLRTEGDKFLPALVLAVIMIFLVLAAQFNSFRDPLIILLGSVPLAFFSALLFTYSKMLNPNVPWWTDGWTTSINIYSQVGLITLIGLIARNGILIVEFANQLQEQGRSKLDAIKQAARTRLRPVLMTTVATVAGHLPLCFVSGPGAAARNSIGLVLVGGMAIGTAFTLFVLPSLYMLLGHNLHATATKTQTSSATIPDDSAAVYSK
jgi:multidrug efflux pump